MRPTAADYPEYFERYVSLVYENDIVALLNAQASSVHGALSGLSDSRAAFRYAPDKWTVRELLGHLVDCERVFGYRALAIARGETFPLPSFDEDTYAALAAHDQVPIDELAEEFATLRRSHVLMLKHLDEAGRTRRGTMSGGTATPLALSFIMAGHVRHHARICTERYGVALRA